MRDITINQFSALCPKCSKQLEDRTYVDRKGDMHFFRTIFECKDDQWALMTRLDEFNSIAPVSEMDESHIMESPLAQIKLDLTEIVMRNFISDGIENYPLDTVEKFVENGDTFFKKKMTGISSAFLHIPYRDLAALYDQRSEKDKELLAIQAAVDYLMRMEGSELGDAMQNKSAYEDVINIFSSLNRLYHENGRLDDATDVAKAAEAWKLKQY